MKTLYLECNMGAAGDMLMAALCELLPDPDAFIADMNALNLPGVRFERLAAQKCGITGTHIAVTVDGEEEFSHDEHHDHEHDHEHEHHHHVHLSDVAAVIHGLCVPEAVKEDALSVYGLIAEAEAAAHGQPMGHIHFHEVGTLDAIADVVGVCWLVNRLAPAQVVVSPVHVGFGEVRCAHGVLPVPAPATAHILEGVPIYGGRIRGELCTPTGAALLRHFASRFGDMPVMAVEKIGYGMGTKDFEWANCVRALWGETGEAGDAVAELRCNIDDMTGEALAFAMEVLRDAGALDVWAQAIQMKKGRPGTMLCVLCRPNDQLRFAELLFKHTTTIGVRCATMNRYTLRREPVLLNTPFGPVSAKRSFGYGVDRVKPEFEDLAEIARQEGVALGEIETEKNARQGEEG